MFPRDTWPQSQPPHRPAGQAGAVPLPRFQFPSKHASCLAWAAGHRDCRFHSSPCLLSLLLLARQG